LRTDRVPAHEAWAAHRTASPAPSQRGQAIIVIALAVPMVFAILALVVDGTRLFVAHQQTQNAADAASLAAARDLPLAGCDSSLGTCPASMQADASQYSQANGGPAITHACATASDTNCWLTPVQPGNQNLVQVRITEDRTPYFAQVVGLGHLFHVSAAAAASPLAVTQTTTIPGGTGPSQTITNLQTITTSTVITNPGPSDLMFAHCGWRATDGTTAADLCTGTSGECTALHISGSNNTFFGGIASNGGVQESGANLGAPPKGNAGLFWGPQYSPGNCVVNWPLPGTWATTGSLPRQDWAVKPPTLTCSDGNTYDGTHGYLDHGQTIYWSCPSGTYPTNVDGVACTLLSTAKFTVNSSTDPSGQPWQGLYCAGGALTINKTGISLNSAGFIAPSITWSSGNNVASGYTGDNRLAPYGGLFLDAYSNTGGLNWSGTGDSWSGAIFAPNDNAQVSGGGVTGVCAGFGNGTATNCGFIEGSTIQVSGSGGVWQGLGPGQGGTTTTVASTITTSSTVTIAGTTYGPATQTSTSATTLKLNQ
jgi:hypothetical protein